MEADASIWYGTVLRADFGPIIVRAGANVQDGSILHGADDGDRALVAAGAVVAPNADIPAERAVMGRLLPRPARTARRVR